VTAGLLAGLAGCGPCGGDEKQAVAPPPPAATASATPSPVATATATAPAVATPTATPAGSLAVGITEPNPNFVWPADVHEIHPLYAIWRDQLARMRPAYYRLVLDWASLQPRQGAPRLDEFTEGCMRAIPPCGGYDGLREQLRALAARQQEGGWTALVVLTGTPEWAARGPGGCERPNTQARSRPPRAGDGMRAYGRFVRTVLTAARAAGADLRYWSPWNEPNHPYFISPQRSVCDAGARSAAIAPYVTMARALKSALDAAPGDQQLVLGELAGLDERKPKSSSVAEFVADIPKDLACGSPVWTQHGYVGGHDPVDDLERALDRKGCERPEIWITETGVGAPRSGEARRTSRAAQVRSCGRLHRRLVRWYRDKRVAAAFQYTLREDDLFPTGLINTHLTGDYPALAEWIAWGTGRRPNPTDAPPPNSCG
jgi:hypothetical protein